MYALAASATGVGALALANPAEAKIVYTRVNQPIPQVLILDLNNDGIADFRLCEVFSGSASYSCTVAGKMLGKQRPPSPASSTLLQRGPIWSRVHESGTVPRLLTRPYVGLNPTIPQ